MPKQLYLVTQQRGEWKSPEDGGTVIEIQGIFSTKEKAEAACVDWTDCVSPLTLDHNLPRESFLKGDAYYPKAQA